MVAPSARRQMSADSEEASVGHPRRLGDGVATWIPAVGVLVGVVGLLLALLACFIFRRWRRRLGLMKKTVNDFSSGVVDVEAQTKHQATTATISDPSRPSLLGTPPPAHPPIERLGTRHVLNPAPPSLYSSSSSHTRPKIEPVTASALLPTPTHQNPPKGLAPTLPTIPKKSKKNRVDARGAAAASLSTVPTIKNIKTKQNRLEDGTASPMTAMSTEAPSSFSGVPPVRWEHEPVDLVLAAAHKRKTSSLFAGKAPAEGSAEDGDDPSVSMLQRKSSSFERARGAIIGFDLDIPQGRLDSASESVAMDGSGASSVRDPPSTSLPPHSNIRSDSACGSVAIDGSGSRTSRRSTVAGDDRLPDASASAPSQRSFRGSGGVGRGGGRRTLEDAGVFESFASLPRGDYTFDSSNSANTAANAARVNVAASSSFTLPRTDSEHITTVLLAGKTRHLPMSPIDSVFGGGAESARHRAHTADGDAVVPYDATSGDLRARMRHRRSKTDFPSPRGGGIDFRWDSAAGSAFRESGADNFCVGCLGTGVQYDSASGSVFPPSRTTSSGTAGLSRGRSSSRFDGGSSPTVVYGEDVEGVGVGNVVGGGVRCYCVRDPSGASLKEGRQIMQGGRQRSFSVSALPHEGSLSRLFGKE